MAAGRERRAAAETFTARLKMQWHRVRVGLRRSAVDYFRGDGSDWVALAGLLIAQFRSRVGVPWRRGGTMLFDLRERIRVQSKLPQLPVGWHREMALRPAGGQSFSGDFVVAARTNGGRTMEVVLTDVSGKG